MSSRNIQRVLGILGLLIILVGATLGYRGVPYVDWIAIFVGALLLTMAIFTGERVLLFDKIRRTR